MVMLFGEQRHTLSHTLSLTPFERLLHHLHVLVHYTKDHLATLEPFPLQKTYKASLAQQPLCCLYSDCSHASPLILALPLMSALINC